MVELAETCRILIERKEPNVFFMVKCLMPKHLSIIIQSIIVPLLSGSGMRVKILEGMFLGRIVITTSLGLEGINAQHKNQVLVADTVEEFVKAVEFCLNIQSKLKT